MHRYKKDKWYEIEDKGWLLNPINDFKLSSETFVRKTYPWE